MKLEYRGINYHIWCFSSKAPVGTGLSVYDLTANTTIMEIFRDETENKIVFNSTGLNVNLEFIELVIGMFDNEIGRKFKNIPGGVVL